MNLKFGITAGIMIPFLATVLGSGAVFLFPKKHLFSLQKVFCGFAAGVMCAASVWSLLIPAMEKAASPLPATVGLMGGILFFALLEAWLERMAKAEQGLRPKGLMAAAVTVHNIPEGMAVGVVLAETLRQGGRGLDAALILALGVAIQNLPEGAILSLPASSVGKSKKKAFLLGAASGIVEPVSAGVALFLTRSVSLGLPYALSFAAGAMLYVVTEELVPQFGGRGRTGAISFGLGFSLMMALDVLLGS